MTSDPAPERPEPEADLSPQSLIAGLTVRTPAPRLMLRDLYTARVLRQTLPRSSPQPSAAASQCCRKTTRASG